MIFRNIRSFRRSVIMHSRWTGDKRSPERSTALNSHRNSEQRLSTSLWLKNCDEGGVRTARDVTSCETLPRLPLVEKRDYIQNWILSGDSSFLPRASPGSRTPASKEEKRFASPPARDCAEKRAHGQRVETKENSELSLNDEENSECEKKLRDEWELAIEVADSPGLKSKTRCSKREMRDRVYKSSEATRPEVSGKSKDRVIRRFSRHGEKSTGRSAATSETEVKRDLIPDTESSGSSIQPEPSSPLRWTGHAIGDSSMPRPRSRRLSSPVVDVDGIVHPSSSGESEDAVILDDGSSAKSKRSPTGSARMDLSEPEPRTPSRWKGYGSPGASNLPEVPLSSTTSEIAASSEPENDDAEDEAKIETESIATTIADVIENVPTQNPDAIGRTDGFRVAKKSSAVSETYDSDETHYSDGNPAHRSVAKVTLREKPLSANDRTILRNRSDVISEVSSSPRNNDETRAYVPASRTPRDIGKRRKRAKKGSLVAKLQSLVSLRVSSLQIWQYRASRNEFKNSHHQFVKLAIRERETRYGRHFLVANILEDAHNLLGNLFYGTNEDGRKASEGGTVTLMIVPEFNGTPKVGLNRIIDVYPPWEVMDRASKVLCVLYFDVAKAQNEPTLKVVAEDDVVLEERVLEEFQCPCLQRGIIDSSCTVKFTNTRPSFMRGIFDSPSRVQSPPA